MYRWTDEPGKWEDLSTYGRWCMVGEQFDGVTTAEVSLSRAPWRPERREPQLKIKVQVRDARLTPKQARLLAQVLTDAADKAESVEG